MFTKEYIRKFLETNNLPLLDDKSSWNNPKILSFTSIEKHQDQKLFLQIFEKDVLEQVGLYIYEKDGEILYIGKASPLRSRLRHHFLESNERHEGAPIFWEFFFNKIHKGGGLNLHLIPMGKKKLIEPKDKRAKEMELIILELFYQELYLPTFEKHFQKFRTLTKNKNPRRKNGVSEEERLQLLEIFKKTA